MVNAIPLEILMSSTKYAWLRYPTHFLKSRGTCSVIRNYIFEYRTYKATHFARRNNCYALLAINKATHILNGPFSCSCSDKIYSKSIKKNRKKVPFFKVYHFSISQQFPDVKVVVVQALIT